MKQKIALFMPSFAGGGAERVFLSLAKGFLASGKKVDLIVACNSGELKTQIDDRVHLVDLKSRRIGLSLMGLIRYLQVEKPDILLSGQTHANVVAIWAKFLSRSSVPTVISEHSNLSPQIRPNIGYKEKLVLLLARIFYRYADGIIAVSKDIKNELSRFLHLPESMIRAISNPLDLERIQSLSQNITNHPWLYEKSLPVILSAGRLSKEKDFKTLLNAFKIVLGKMDSRLIILGEGPERSSLEKQVSESGLLGKVSLPGFEQNPYPYMRLSDVFVLSSIYEGFALALVEAMACGIPVISTDNCGGPVEILESGKYGKLVPSRSPAAMADAILAILESPVDGSPARLRALDFSLERITAQYLKFFETVEKIPEENFAGKQS
jgi:glycosyltransferase involved in cell wall biosynthesis